MLNNPIITELSNKIKEMILKSPAGDLEKNLDALLRGVFTKMELISREEFDIQTEILKNTREKLEILEQKLSALEVQNSNPEYKPDHKPGH